MKARGRIRQILNTTTGKLEWSPYPATLDEAVRENVAKYLPSTRCPVHGERSVIFVMSGLPGCCVHNNAAKAYNEAAANGEPTTILQANNMKLNYFWSPKAHDLCGHPGKTLFNGKCFFCKEQRDNSPRQLALNAGETWYMPLATDPCTKGHVALRRVNNGSCKQCEEERRAGEAPAQVTRGEVVPINKMCPDLVISKKDAKALGYKVYRTGEPCRVGHRGWRYISTGCCLDCKNG